MVVNDQLDAATLLGIMLERNGFSVLRIDDAVTALDVMAEFTPDVFVINASLRGTNGIELCRQIRRQPRLAQTPVIILTSQGDLKKIGQGFEAGANECLIQPILCHDLMKAIQRVLQNIGPQTHMSAECLQA
jgi:two-component system phosphate regulon response regulator PhoB